MKRAAFFISLCYAASSFIFSKNNDRSDLVPIIHLESSDSVKFHYDAVYLALREMRSNKEYRRTVFVPDDLVTFYFCALKDIFEQERDSLNDFYGRGIGEIHFFENCDPEYFRSLIVATPFDSTAVYPLAPSVRTMKIFGKYNIIQGRTSLHFPYDKIDFTYHAKESLNLAAINYILNKTGSPDSVYRVSTLAPETDSLWTVQKTSKGILVKRYQYKPLDRPSSEFGYWQRVYSSFIIDKTRKVHYGEYKVLRIDSTPVVPMGPE